ncbi:MAG: histidinol-phosphate transaminase [Acidobacteria bacterium]|nr:MAG: histidinol-phosphate transaminase [Acidobacteriota bacterium]
MLKAREAVRTLKEYHPPLGNREGLRLDFNENTGGCSPRVLEKLRSLDGETLARYPQREPAETVVATSLGVSPEELLLTNGTDEAIHLICETYLEPEDEAIIVVPTFAMFEIYAAATGAQVIAIPASENFQFPTEEVIARITARTRLIAIANPNNPTGAFVPIADLRRLANTAPDAALLVDEAYFEFCGETIAPGWRDFPNLFVTRTFSKAYGMAGLRIGVLMGHRDQMHLLRRASSPYNLNAVALACLPEAVADQEYVQDYVAQALTGRRDLESELEALDIRYWPSRANFVLLHLGSYCQPFIREMRQRGILVRDRSSDYGCKDCVRITVGLHEHNQQLLAALREVFVQIGMREKVSR